MKIFIICCLLFIHVNMCIFICGFRASFGFRVSAGLVLVMDFHPNRFRVRVRVSISGFDFGFRLWVHGDSTRSEPDLLPSLVTVSGGRHYLLQSLLCVCWGESARGCQGAGDAVHHYRPSSSSWGHRNPGGKLQLVTQASPIAVPSSIPSLLTTPTAWILDPCAWILDLLVRYSLCLRNDI